jgi:hypothetical protein
MFPSMCKCSLNIQVRSARSLAEIPASSSKIKYLLSKLTMKRSPDGLWDEEHHNGEEKVLASVDAALLVVAESLLLKGPALCPAAPTADNNTDTNNNNNTNDTAAVCGSVIIREPDDDDGRIACHESTTGVMNRSTNGSIAQGVSFAAQARAHAARFAPQCLFS